MLKFLDYVMEEKERHAVVAFGRMNPPTTGHEALVNKVKEHAAHVGGNAHVYLSHSQDAKKNPLSYEHKVSFAQKAFGDTIKKSPAKNPLETLKDLHKQGYHHVTMVAGSDRVDEYKNLLHKYNGHPDHYNFKSIHVVSAGERDPDSEGVSGMSASKMREHAKTSNHEGFKSGLPDSLKKHSKEIMHHVRTGMNISEAKDTTTIVYARVPPKPLQKGPIQRQNSSGVLEYLKQLVVGIKNKNAAMVNKPNRKVNDKIVGMYAGDTNKNGKALTESYESFTVAKAAGYSAILTAADLGIKMKGGFAHHPSVEKELTERMGCGCDEKDCEHELEYKLQKKRNLRRKQFKLGDES